MRSNSNCNLSPGGGLCEENPATGSQWCTSAEVLATSNPPAVLGQAWVRPVFVGFSDFAALDASGWTDVASDMTCCTYHNASCTGLISDGDGRFRSRPCSEVKPVACCALVP